MNEDITIRPEDTAGKKTKKNAAVPKGAKHWKSERDAEGVETLILDREGRSENALNQEVLEELEAILDRLENDPPAGVIIRSGKPENFVFGADIGEFQGLDDAKEVEKRIGEAHRLFDRVEALKAPTVAVIHGNCLGGGLELALACDYRVARDDAKLGFPEINLGIFPAFGGVTRLTRLIPASDAIQMMLTARTLDAKRAKRMGILDDVQPARHLDAAARRAVAKGFTRRHGELKTGLYNSGPARALLAPVMRRKTAEKAREDHYPAPFVLIDAWRAHGGDRDAMLKAEAKGVGKLITGETAQNLVRAFFLRERLKDTGKNTTSEIHSVHVIGAGVMGGDIAAWCALRGLRVSLTDVDAGQIGKAVGRAHELFEKKLRESAKVRDAHDRLMPDPGGHGVRRADLVIEAVAEKLDVKKTVFKDVEAKAKADALLATNTSSIPLEDIAKALERPERLIGLHFFNPVAKLPLVEVVRSKKSDDASVSAGAAFANAIGKLPLPVKSVPGFLVNRALSPYMLEAMLMLEDGISGPTIDAAAERFGMPMGPIELADSVGLDIALEVGRMLAKGTDLKEPERLAKLVEEGKLGKKSGEGFYKWSNGKAQKPQAEQAPTDAMADRLILPMINTFAACVREKVVEDADLADAGAVFGTGFAPFRGGPLNYAQKRGVEDIEKALQDLAKTHGDRFKPDAYWSKGKGKGRTKSGTKTAAKKSASGSKSAKAKSKTKSSGRTAKSGGPGASTSR